MSKKLLKSASIARWAARVLSAAILLFWGYFLVAHLVGTGGRSSQPLGWRDWFLLVSLIASLMGLAVAWKQELLGSTVALVAAAICAAVNWKVLVFPGILIPITALLFMISWWQRKVDHGEIVRRRATG